MYRASESIPDWYAIKGAFFRGCNEFRHWAKTRQKRNDALGEFLLCEDRVAGRYIIQ